MSDNESISSASDDDGGDFVFTIRNKKITETQLIRWLNSTKRKDKKALNTFITQAIAEYKGTEMFKILFKNGYQIAVMNSQRQTVIHLAFYDECYLINGRHQWQGHLRSSNDYCYYPNEGTNVLIKKWLLKQPGSLDCTDTYGLNYLHIACFMGNFKVVKKFLNSNNINTHFCHPESLYKNFTPLHFAVINDSPDAVSIVEHLLEHGADVNATDSKGRTPFHLACRLFIAPLDYEGRSEEETSDKQTLFDGLSKCSSKNISIMKVLLEYHSSIETKDNDGNTPLLSIFPDNYYELSREKDEWHFDSAVPIEETMTKFAMLVEAGADISVTNKKKDSILHLTVENIGMWRSSSPTYLYPLGFEDFYHKAIVEQIFKIKKEFDVNSVNKNGETSLQLAVNYFSCDVIESLLEHGAEVSNLKISWGSKKLFDHINTTPNFDMVCNLIAMMDLFNNKNYDISAVAQLAVLRFLIHKQQDHCECYNDIHDLLHFGSASHVVRILTEMYNETARLDLCTHSLDLYLDDIAFAGFYIDPRIIIALTNFGEITDAVNYENHKNDLIKEINTIKSINLQNNRSLFDIMIKHPHDVPDSAMSNFDSSVLGQFTFYDDIILGHLTKIMVRQYVLKFGVESLQNLCPLLPDLCQDAVLRFLSNVDIVNMFAATSSMDTNETRFFV